MTTALQLEKVSTRVSGAPRACCVKGHRAIRHVCRVNINKPAKLSVCMFSWNVQSAGTRRCSPASEDAV